MNFEMIKYVFAITTEHIHKLEVKNEEKRVSLYDITQKRVMELNDTRVDVTSFDYVKATFDCEFHEFVFDFYTYQTIGECMDLVLETTVTTRQSTLDSFQIL